MARHQHLGRSHGSGGGSAVSSRLASPPALVAWFTLAFYAAYSFSMSSVPSPMSAPPTRKTAQVASNMPLQNVASVKSSTRTEPQPLSAQSLPKTSSCKTPPRLYHTLLTAQSTVYQNWQSEMMYYHYKKQRSLQGECGDMGGFTRLTASAGGRPDSVADRMPSFFVPEISHSDLARKYKGFGVLNRPMSIVQAIRDGLLDKIEEDYVYIAETDHLLMQPLPNLSPHKQRPAAFTFSYMIPNPGFASMIQRFWPEGGADGYKKIPPIGPSPMIIHKDILRDVADEYYEMSKKLKMDGEADSKLGWVIEMWGFAIAAAKRGISFELVRNFQIELSSELRYVPEDFSQKHWIFHYTYGLEYRMTGDPQGVWQIGEWSLDKRHYGNAYPPKGGLLTPPPKGSNAAAFWLQRAWAEAVDNIEGWPDSRTMGTIGWRRNKATSEDISNNPWVEALVDSRWKWAGTHILTPRRDGTLSTPWGNGMWSVVGSADGEWTLGFDFAANLHNVRFDRGFHTAMSTRVGDNEKVMLKREE